MIINPGASEKSAYQYAVDGGYKGTEDEFQALMGSGPWLPVSGGTVTGPVEFSGRTINDFFPGGVDVSVLFKPYTLKLLQGNRPALFVGWAFDSSSTIILRTNLGLENKRIFGVAPPENDDDAVNRKYVEERLTDDRVFAKKIVVSPDQINEPNAFGQKVNVGFNLDDKVIFFAPDPDSEEIIKSCGIRWSHSGWYLIFKCDTLPSVDVTFHLMAKTPL